MTKRSDKILAPIKGRVLKYVENKGFEKKSFFEKLGVASSNFRGNALFSEISSDVIAKILTADKQANPEWLLTGKGEMLKSENPTNKRNLIPLYDDVATIGGTEIVAEMQGVSEATEYIDAGDWFKDVTAAIRHYGNSMQEYPNGCILALRKITSIRGVVWGRNYVVETNETRVTKRIQTCIDDDKCIMAYSTNTEKYPDGRLIHEPFKIYKEDIRHIFLVIGRVVKEYSSDPVYTIQK